MESAPTLPLTLFLNEWDGNFGFQFCKNIEDKFNRGMPCITHSVVLHAYLRTFCRHQVMYDVFCIEPCVEVACKRLFFIQQHSKEQGQALVSDHCQHCFGFMLHF